MSARHRRKDSNLFLVRLWQEEAEGGDAVWCGKVQRVVSGESRYFRSLPELAETMLAITTQYAITPSYTPTQLQGPEAEAK